MSPEEKLLSYIHKNAAMGTRSIPQVLSYPQSGAMRRALDQQLREYRNIARESKEYAQKLGHDVAEPTMLSQGMSAMMLRMQTLTDKSTSRLAELMIQGNTMGLIQITRHLNYFRYQPESKAVALGEKLLKTEEQNISQLKKYL